MLYRLIYVLTYDIGRRKCFAIDQQNNELANVSLLRVGMLGCSPVDPSVAISLDSLELYHRLRRRHGQLGVQAMARVLCDLHDVSFCIVQIPKHILTCPTVYLPNASPRAVVNRLRCISGYTPTHQTTDRSCLGPRHTQLACSKCMPSVQLRTRR